MPSTRAGSTASTRSTGAGSRSPTGAALKDRETYVSDTQRRNSVASIRLQAGGEFLVAFHQVHQLHGVVVAVAQIDFRGAGDETGWIVQQAVHHIPQRPDETAHLGEAAFVVVKAVHHLARGLF